MEIKCDNCGTESEYGDKATEDILKGEFDIEVFRRAIKLEIVDDEVLEGLLAKYDEATKAFSAICPIDYSKPIMGEAAKIIATLQTTERRLLKALRG